MVNDWECVCIVDMGEGEKLVVILWIDIGIKVGKFMLIYI